MIVSLDVLSHDYISITLGSCHFDFRICDAAAQSYLP